MNAESILKMVKSLSGSHVLQSMPKGYISDFVNAALNVYDSGNIKKVLRQKFCLPNETNFAGEAYLESAAELSVANYVKSTRVADFETEKKVNVTNKKM